MDKDIVVVVLTEAGAYELVAALKELDADGSIELYSATVIARSVDGAMTIRNARDLHAPRVSELGFSTGALIGLLGGPLGAGVGVGDELAYSGFAADFVHDVAVRFAPGDHAVCASAWEDWSVPVDVSVAPFGGVVFRHATDEAVVARIRVEALSLREEEAQLDVEIARAVGDVKDRLEARGGELRAAQAAERERLRKRANRLSQRWEARLSSIRGKASGASFDAKARHHAHAERLARFAAAHEASFRELFA